MTGSVHLTSDAPLGELFALAERALRADGQPPFNDQSLTAVRTGRSVPLFAVDDDKAVVGALVRQADEFELVVDPRHRGRGLGDRLAAHVVAASVPGTLAWAHGDLPASRRLAEKWGFDAVRTLLQLRLDLADSSPAQPSGASTVSTFRVGRDEEEWLALNALVFAGHPEQGSLTADDLRAREADPWFDAGDFLIVRDETGRMVGYDWVKIDPDEPEIGEIYVLGIHPDAAGRGLGRALLSAGLHRMRERGALTAALYVEADNTSAVALYRSAGFTDHTIDVQYRLR